MNFSRHPFPMCRLGPRARWFRAQGAGQMSKVDTGFSTCIPLPVFLAPPLRPYSCQRFLVSPAHFHCGLLEPRAGSYTLLPSGGGQMNDELMTLNGEQSIDLKGPGEEGIWGDGGAQQTPSFNWLRTMVACPADTRKVSSSPSVPWQGSVLRY